MAATSVFDDDEEDAVALAGVTAAPLRIASLAAEGLEDVEEAPRDEETDVAVVELGTFDATVETVWHAVEVASPNREDGDDEVLPHPAAFALPAVTHHSATAPSTRAAAHMATDSDPPRDKRMPISHVTTPRDSSGVRGMGASVLPLGSNCAGEAPRAAQPVPPRPVMSLA